MSAWYSERYDAGWPARFMQASTDRPSPAVQAPHGRPSGSSSVYIGQSVW